METEVRLAKEFSPEEYDLVQSDWDKEAIEEYAGIERGEYTTYIVKVERGDYTEIWGSHKYLVLEDTPFFRIK